MEHIKNKWIGLLQKVLGSILVMLGFSACDNPFKPIAGMYGAPYSDYTIKGTITDEAGEPVTSANVIIRDLGYKRQHLEYEGGDFYNREYYNDTIKVDAKGEYSYKTIGDGWSGSEFRIIANDIAHEQDSVDIAITITDEDKVNDKDNTWLIGTVEETVNFTLKKKNEQD